MRIALPVVGLFALGLAAGGGEDARGMGGRGQEPRAPMPRAVPRADALVSDWNCAACHSLPDTVVERLQPKTAPRLDDVATRRAPSWLERYLDDPRGTEPSATMPDLLTGLEGEARADAVDALVHFLATLGEPLDRAVVGVRPGVVERGRRLYHTIGCVACHPPLEGVDALEQSFARSDGDAEPVESSTNVEIVEDELYVPPGTFDPPDIPLGDLAAKTTVEALAAFLRDPLAVRPDGRMPSLGLDEDEAWAIAAYLILDPGAWEEDRFVPVPGIAYDYYEAPFQDPVADFDALPATRGGVTDGFRIDLRDRDDRFGFRFSGLVDVPTAGEYTFFTTSDDGSRLWVNGRLVVQNDGFHGMVERSGPVTLDEGRHTLEVTMFERDGGEGLEVRWQGPGIEKSPIPPERLAHLALALEPPGPGPFEVDDALAEEGRALFRGLGCVACHDTGIPELDDAPGPAPRPLLELAGSTGGCLAESPPAGTPSFGFDTDDRAALSAGIGGLDRDVAADERVRHTLARFSCYSCHRRDDLGGPHPLNRPFFVADEDAELGDEGRIPPVLTGVGAKLRESWLTEVMLHGGSARPYMATRMPQFGAGAVEPLVDLFAEVDLAEPEPERDTLAEDEIANGRLLVGTDGLGCIQCHTFAGHKSLGVQAVDLAHMYARLRPGYFRVLLADPNAVNMNTRMPEVWTDGKSPIDVYDRDPERQIAAMWSYLSLGPSMPLPAGIAIEASAWELTPTEEPVTCGVFMKGVSPRTLAVGFSENAHYAFDMQNARLAKVWRGRFFNARGTWEGRAGGLELPPTDDVRDLPPGMPFAYLRGWYSWPDTVGRDADFRWLGRSYDGLRRPVFRYRMGDVEIEEKPVPDVRFGGSWIRREFRLSAAREPADLWFRAAVGESAELDGEGRWRVGGDAPMLIAPPQGASVNTRTTETGVDLLWPVEFERTTSGEWVATFDVEMTW